jgi:hypothetical protein
MHRSNYARPARTIDLTRERPPVVVERAGERKPFKPKPPKKWSHQDQLESLKNKEIYFQVVDRDNGIKGVLLEADQFTIQVEVEHFLATDVKSVLTYFKSQVVFFTAV